MKIAIQGIKGSYHHQLAQELYGTTELVECKSFDALALAVSGGSASTAVMAIGNSIAGSILPNYQLIKAHDLFINGESYLNINHQFMALKEQAIDDIEEVQSHPMALLQCSRFLAQHPHIKVVETDDTAAAARRIAKDGKMGVAAIASSLAADLYDLETLAGDIQDTENNVTRFLTLGKVNFQVKKADKATINFSVSHEAGSLGKILTIWGKLGINLSKIQSIPITEKPFLFSFVADLEFENTAIFKKSISEVEPLTKSLMVLGIYKSKNL
ncbi:MAG: prephenate dehydratase domain-containing protein [Nonlabens sp.]